jgi:hypothetical protein
MRVRAPLGVRLLKACRVVILAAALVPPFGSDASRKEATDCAAPAVEVASEAGGQRQISIQSPCRKGELVIGRYGGFVVMARFDSNGNLIFRLDCFLGDRDLELTFADDQRATSHACATLDVALTKVAIVWQDRVDLDLHAFEYAALPGSPYDRSARSPGSYQAAQLEYVRSGRSHGFISTVSDGRQPGHNVEVYTLLRHTGEARGLIAMALSLGAAISGSCNGGPLRVDLDVYILEQGSRLRNYARTFAAPSCGGAAEHLFANLVPNIVLGTAGGADAR